MATLIPSLNASLPKINGGERRFAWRLEEELEEDYRVWYDVPVGATGYHPDFIILHPGHGLLVLEVKDWKPETFQRIDKGRATILTKPLLIDRCSPAVFAAPLPALDRPHSLAAMDGLKWAGVPHQ